MKKLILLIASIALLPLAAYAELQQVDLTIFGMD